MEYSLQYAIAEGYKTEEPIRGSAHAAGMDVFLPRGTERMVKDLNEKNGWAPPAPIAEFNDSLPYRISVGPHERIVIPTGLRFNIPEGTYLEVANRGSVAAKMGLVYGAHIIDEDYGGIVFINLINTTEKWIELESGAKIAQLIHKEYIKSQPARIPESDIRVTARGDGALGSTGK